MDKVKVKINIAGRSYPLTVENGEEEVLRRAGKMINEKIQLFEKNYAVSDKQDALAMAALQICASYLGTQKKDDLAEEASNKQLHHLIYKLQETLQ